MKNLFLMGILITSVSALSAGTTSDFSGASIGISGGGSFANVKVKQEGETQTLKRNFKADVLGLHVGWDQVFNPEVLWGVEFFYDHRKGGTLGLQAKLGYLLSSEYNIVGGILAGTKRTRFRSTTIRDTEVDIDNVANSVRTRKFRGNAFTTGVFVTTKLPTLQKVEITGQFTYDFYQKRHVEDIELKYRQGIVRLKIAYRI